jgi:hypothetical protein
MFVGAFHCVGYQNCLMYCYCLFMFLGDFLCCKKDLGVGRGQIGSACCCWMLVFILFSSFLGGASSFDKLVFRLTMAADGDRVSWDIFKGSFCFLCV